MCTKITIYVQKCIKMSQPNVVVEVDETKEANGNPAKPNILTRFKNFYIRNFLPIGIVLSIIIGILLPQPAVYLSQRIPVAKICIIALFFVIGLRLRVMEAKSAVKSYKEVVVGLFLVLFVGPVIATVVISKIPYFGSLIGDGLNLKNTTNNNMTDDQRILGPEEFRLGLQIYLMCPSAPAASLALVSSFFKERCHAVVNGCF